VLKRPLCTTSAPRTLLSHLSHPAPQALFAVHHDRTPRDFACDQALHAPKLEGVVGKVVPTNMNKSPKPLEQDFVYGAASRPGVYALQCTPPSMGEDRRSWQAYHAPY
jgi:hypothetical protein